jgi:cation diffusion facilitator CzcD-associated flavoprotein CzcO
MDRCDVAIVGAGPYGLSAAAHICHLKGLDVRLLGEPMSFWEHHMPEGMLLRSPWAGSHIADPGNCFTLDAYKTVNGNRNLADPIPARDFIRYGHWFLREADLSVDRRKVMRIELAPYGYELTLDAGEALYARRVVVAGGIQPFAFRPELFAHLPPSLVTHTSEQRDFSKFRGKEVLVIGGGQSALEAAVFLREAGAQPEVLVRGSGLYWLDQRRWMRKKEFRWMFYGAGEIGPAGASLIVQRPNLFRRLPSRVQRQWTAWALRPAVAQWVKPRAHDIRIHTERFLVEARAEGGRLRVRFNDGTDRGVDHVVLGTGYRVNVHKYPFLSSRILERIDIVNGHPRLAAGFETSLPGLHFLGAPAAWSFGPLMRFVAGTDFASPALRRRILEANKRLITVPSTPTGRSFEAVRLESGQPK